MNLKKTKILKSRQEKIKIKINNEIVEFVDKIEDKKSLSEGKQKVK